MAANKGEWAELYVLFKLLGEGKIYAADDSLNRNSTSYLSILRIIREEVKNKLIEYNTDSGVTVEIKIDGCLVASIPAQDFLCNAQLLIKTILTSAGRTFDVLPQTQQFMKTVKVSKPKAGSKSKESFYATLGGKNDIIMEVYDHSTSLATIAGFSIKSKYSNPATLFNAAVASNFVYELKNINDRQMCEINQFMTRDGKYDKNNRTDYMIHNNIEVQFSHVKILPQNDHSFFEDNLILVHGNDTIQVVNEILKVHFFKRRYNCKITDICDELVLKNPMNVRNPVNYYPKVIKDLLYASFSGMTASEEWDGRGIVNGGYIVAKDNGDVLVYHTRDGETYKTFLFNNTKIDRPDADPTRCNYAYVYKENSKYYFDLNFQIRFIK